MWGKWNPTEVASVGCLEKNYDQFKEFYKMRLEKLEGVKPNKGHIILAEWEKVGKVTGIITQNTDGLHFEAGSKNVAAIHGNLRTIFCDVCRREYSIADFMSDKMCECGGKLRPGVVLFGEGLPRDKFALAEELTDNCKTFVVLGSSLTVSPANMFPSEAKRHGADVVIVNATSTPLDGIAKIVINGPINDYLTAVDDEFRRLAHDP